MNTYADNDKILNKKEKPYLGLYLIRSLILSAGIFFAALDSTPLYANPEGGNVVAGSAAITQTNSTTLTINQSTDKAIINWQSFSIAANETTRFNQPSSSSVTLNRVLGNDASQILGRLSANGQIMLLNPNGIIFGKNAIVDVAGLIASTAHLSDQNFLSGVYHFIQDANKNYGIVNNGLISVKDQGLVALVAPGVENNGIIQANLGKVVLASGREFTIVDTYGDNLISFATGSQVTQTPLRPDGTPMRDAVRNSGTIIADGGKVLMTARAAAAVVDNVINMDGIVQANSVIQRNGEIILSGGNEGIVKVSGKVYAKSNTAGVKGGKVKVTGQKVGLFAGADIDVSGNAGGGEILIGGDYQGKNPDVQNAQATYMDANATLKADAIENGDGGKIIVWADDATRAYGTISARGGALSGNGGFIETSGHNYLDVNGISIDTRAQHGNIGTWLLDPTNIYIANDQTSATTAGMSGTDASANTGSGGDPNVFQASGAVQNSLLTVGNLQTALGTTNVTVTTTNASGTGAGNIFLIDPITWSSANTLTLTAAANIFLNSSITATNGGVAFNAPQVWSCTTCNASPNTVAITGSLNVANFNLMQGVWNQVATSAAALTSAAFNVTGDFQIASGALFARMANATGGPTTGTNLIYDVFGLQGINHSFLLSRTYQLGQNIDASTTTNWNNNSGFVPIGTAASSFIGSFDGQGFSISNLFINRASSDYIGLFGYVTNAIANVGLTNANIVGRDYVGGIAAYVTNNASIQDTYNTGGSISANAWGGGIVGYLDSGSISNSFNESNVTGSGGQFRGGIAGFMNSGTISNAYNTGNITANNGYIGGIVGGTNGGTISNTYNMGTVTYTNPSNISSPIGGIAGQSASNISNSYSIGRIISLGSLNSFAGGLVGASSGSVINSYWNPGTSGKSTSSGGTALSTSQMMTQANFSGWDFTNTWNIIAGQSLPYLRTFYSTTPRIIAGATTGEAGTTVTFAGNGAIVGNTQTYADGSFYYFTGINNLSLSNNTIADGLNFLAYLDNGTVKGNAVTIVPTSNGSLSNATGLTIATNTVTVGGNGTANLNNSILASAKGALNDSDILYTYSGNDVTLTAGQHFATTFNTNYNLSGNITSDTGNITFNGPTTLGTAITLASDTGNITFNGSLGGAQTLAINTSGITTFNGQVNGLTSLTTDLGGTTTINGVEITTTGAQTYNDAVTLGAAATTLTGVGLTFGSTINGGQTLAINDSGTTTFGGVIGGTTALTSLTTDAGGTTVINGGAITTTGAQTYGDTVTLNTNTTLSGNNITFDSVLQGASLSNFALTINDTGTTTFNNTFGFGTNALGSLTINATGGSTVFNGGNVTTTNNQSYNNNIVLNTNKTFTSSSGSISAAAINGNNNSLTINNATTGQISGIMSNLSAFNKQGAGSLTLAAANTYSGSTSISNGILRMGIENALPTTNLVIISGGATLDLNNFNTTVGSISGSSGNNITLGSGNLTVGDSTNSTFSGSISGSGNLIKQGTGTLSLGGTSTYTGSSIINNGILEISSDASLGTAPVTPTANKIIFNGGKLMFAQAMTLNANRGIALNASGGTLRLGLGGLTVTYGGTITGSGVLNLESASSGGVLILSGTNDYSGDTNIATNARLLAGATNAFSNNSTYNIGGGTFSRLDLNGFDNAIGGLTGNGLLLLGANTLTIGNNNQSTSFTGTISGSGGINKVGTGTLNILDFNGVSGPNTYTGATNIFNGTLAAGYIEAFGSGTAGININPVAGATAILDLSALALSGALTNTGTISINSSNAGSNAQLTTAGTYSLGNSINLTGAANTIAVNSGNLTASGQITGSGNLIKNAAGTLTLSGNNTYEGGTTLSAGTLSVGNNTALGSGTLALNAGTLTASSSGINLANVFTVDGTGITIGGSNNFTLSGNGTLNALLTNTNSAATTLSGALSGANGITQNSAGTLTLSGLGTNTYDGATTVTQGTLIADKASAMGSTIGSTTVADGATLNINDTAIGAEALNITGNGVGGNGALIGTGTASLSGGITLAGTTTFGGTGSLTLSGVINDAASTFGITKVGAGNLILTNANTYDGGTTLSAGTLSVGNNTALGSGTLALNAGTLTASSSGINLANAFTIGSGNTATINGTNNLALNGTGTFGNSSSILNITNTAGTITLGGALSGAGALNRNGVGGTLAISNINNTSYTGPVTLTSGTLSVSGTSNPLGTGQLNLNGGTLLIPSLATLTNNFTVNGTVAILGSSILNMNGTGTLNTGSTLTSSTGTRNFTGSLSGDGALTFTGGVATLSGDNNSYSGTISLASGNPLLVVGRATNALGTGLLVLNAGTIQSSLSATVTNPFSVGGNVAIGSGSPIIFSGNGALNSGTLTISNTNPVALSGNLSGAGALNLNSISGTLTISGADNSARSGTTTLTTGTLQIGVATNALGSGSLALNGGNLQSSVAASLANIYTVGGAGSTINGSSDLTLNGAGTLSALLTNTNSATTTLSGALSGTNGITQNSSGTLILSGSDINDANTYDGTTTISQGILSANKATALGSIVGSTSVANGATLNINNAIITGEILTLNGAGVGGNGVLTGSGTATYTGTNTLTLGSDTTIGSNAASTLTLNTAIDDPFALSLTGLGTIALGGNVNTTSLTANVANLAINTTAITTSGAQTYNDAVTLGASSTLKSGNGTITFANTLSGAAQTLSLQDATAGSTGSVIFNGAITLGGLTTFGGAANYAVQINNGGTIANATTFSNTGGVTLAGTTLFDGGLTSTASANTINGNVRTSADTMTLGATTLTGTSSLDTTNNGGSAAGNNISVGAITSGGNALTLNAGSAGTVAGSSFAGNGNLTLTNSAGTAFSGAINAGTVTLTDSTNNIVFNGALNATALNTAAETYGVQINNGGTITNATTFSNTGGVTLGGTTLFDGGLTSTASANTINGNVRTSADTMTLGATTLTGVSSLDTTNNGGSAAGNNISVGTITSGGNALTLNAGSAGTVAGSSFAGNGNLTLTNSAGTAFSGAINAGTVTLTDSTNNIVFNGALNATALNTAAETYGVQINNGGTIANATTFSNTGGVTLAGTTLFDGGLTSTASANTINGNVRTSADTMTLGATTLTGTSSLDTTNNGAAAAGSNITVGAITSGGNALTLNAGNNDITLNQANTLSSVGAIGNDISINNTTDLILAASTASGTFNVTTTNGSITQSGVLDIDGVATFTLNTANTDVLLGTQANDFASAINFVGTPRDIGLRNINNNAAGILGSLAGMNLRNLTVVFDNSAVVLPAITNLSNNLSVTAGGDITQNNALNLNTGATATLTSTAANGNINFNTAVDGNFTLEATAGSNGAINFNADIGGITPLAHVETGATGQTNLGANITTSGNSIIFNNPVNLVDNVTLTDTGTTGIQFNSTVNGGFDLTLDAQAGTVGFTSGAGNISSLDQLSIYSFNFFSFSNITVNGLELGGNDGGNITGGTIAGISGSQTATLTTLGPIAFGNFFVNGCLVPGGCSITPATPPFNDNQAVSVLSTAESIENTNNSTAEAALEMQEKDTACILNTGKAQGSSGNGGCKISIQGNDNTVKRMNDLIALNKNINYENKNTSHTPAELLITPSNWENYISANNSQPLNFNINLLESITIDPIEQFANDNNLFNFSINVLEPVTITSTEMFASLTP